MSTIQLNGAPRPLAAGTTLAELVTDVTGRELLPTGKPADGGRLGVAVARNSGIVPRSQWSVTELEQHDDIEIVTAVQGG
ncbi:sulfur carrier protein ThiS [Paeniglutamicibacter sulfureus]|uniref:Sulfur carrier protein n=1 Tax=Paeniglutamicibacter sulfureus TaxID=43666 RepID=A0ABU2BIP4_9MICC|nr:sulfur carrier protein ThiS [Paeniglutamicibacter sulfureus]MDO2934286.1 sulfur carrier protein ThiS [Paeniglutamicibacter sulfureus]MDR7358473.1 sulfur carrier protein [Paeniglutamicibacter sulfureus]